MSDRPILEIHDGTMPLNGAALAKEIYTNTAEAMEVGQWVETIDRKTTAGIIRALERLDRHGRQRTFGGTLTVWRVR